MRRLHCAQCTIVGRYFSNRFTIQNQPLSSRIVKRECFAKRLHRYTFEAARGRSGGNFILLSLTDEQSGIQLYTYMFLFCRTSGLLPAPFLQRSAPWWRGGGPSGRREGERGGRRGKEVVVRRLWTGLRPPAQPVSPQEAVSGPRRRVHAVRCPLPHPAPVQGTHEGRPRPSGLMMQTRGVGRLRDRCDGKLQALVYDIPPSRKVPESDARSVM